MSLKRWTIDGSDEPKTLNEGNSLLAGNFSPNGKHFAAIAADVSDSSITLVYTFSLDDPKKQSVPAISTINISHSEVGDIAVDDFGSTIALQTNGISIWNLNPDPELKALIPAKQSSNRVSFGFNEKRTDREDGIMVFNYDNTTVNSQTWSIIGDEGVIESCEDCDAGFSSEHPELNARIEETTLIISKKSDSKEIDRIDFGETIEEFAFSADGNEVLTTSYKDNELFRLGVRLGDGGDKRNYRKWKIGFQNLKPFANEKLKQF